MILKRIGTFKRMEEIDLVIQNLIGWTFVIIVT